METIHVYADFDFLPQKEEIGVLHCEHLRGQDHFSFEYSRSWLAHRSDIILCGDVMNAIGRQFPRGKDGVFGFVRDTFPDRWGCILLDRREQLMAQAENRPARTLTPYNYLVDIEDFTRMGGIRFKRGNDTDFINAANQFAVPPIESLGALCEACHEIEKAEESGQLPAERWLNQLVNPGSSLGGARPKANVLDKNGQLYVAKFPSRKDIEDAELLEHFAHLMARHAGIQTANTATMQIGKGNHLLLSERFDRHPDGRRVHFASAMALLGLNDGDGAGTGHGYLDIVDFIIKGCADAQINLRELYRRVAFNILFGNTDDHFRNHGFLLTPKGWTLAPAYDLNPSTNHHQCLLINNNTASSNIQALLDACEDYMLDHKEANEIIAQVRDSVRDWETVANTHHISPRLLAKYFLRWSRQS